MPLVPPMNESANVLATVLAFVAGWAFGFAEWWEAHHGTGT